MYLTLLGGFCLGCVDVSFVFVVECMLYMSFFLVLLWGFVFRVDVCLYHLFFVMCRVMLFVLRCVSFFNVSFTLFTSLFRYYMSLFSL